MKNSNKIVSKAAAFFLITTLVCGVLYTGVITVLGQVIFPDKANGSIITVDNVQYGSYLLAQNYTSPKHMWGRIMNLDVSTYTDENGKPLVYAGPSNLSPNSEDYKELIDQRVDMIQSAHPEMSGTPIPVDLVTCSGSGLDPHISIAAANYQVKRIAKNNNISEDAVQSIIDQCTTNRFLGLFGEKTVNVLEFNLRLDGILK